MNKVMIYSSAIVIGALATGLAFAYYQNNILVKTSYEFKKKVNNEIKVVQISDLHSKSFGQKNKKLLNKLVDTNADIYVATGDIIDSSKKRMNEIIEFLIELNNHGIVIYIPGNNEMRSGEVDNIIDKLKKGNVIALKNEITDIEVKGNKINILGLAEWKVKENNVFTAKIKDSYMSDDYKRLFEKLEKKEGLKIVLSHYPENFKGKEEIEYSKYKFDILFAGHAHGGQFIIPFIGGLFAPGQGILPKYYKGLHNSQYNNSKLIINRGLGNSGFPLRLFNRPEIVEVKFIT